MPHGCRRPEERAAFLAVECAGDAELRREVESLLAQPTSGDGFLGQPAVVVAAQMITKPGATVLTGRRIRRISTASTAWRGWDG